MSSTARSSPFASLFVAFFYRPVPLAQCHQGSATAYCDWVRGEELGLENKDSEERKGEACSVSLACRAVESSGVGSAEMKKMGASFR